MFTTLNDVVMVVVGAGSHRSEVLVSSSLMKLSMAAAWNGLWQRCCIISPFVQVASWNTNNRSTTSGLYGEGKNIECYLITAGNLLNTHIANSLIV